ncbi:ExbD/TolR family protein [Pantanalinema sp. GBBB05]|uniref:ExbD/TolR family protein n=1 Tax=Pantanalinema sp. GBBB05 TaxID=2604139 RepID=UPI003D81BB37
MSLRSRRQQHTSPVDVNLVPMMDVILTILTFFIIISMTLSNQKSLNVPLPRVDQSASEVKQADPLVIGLNLQGQILLAGKPANGAELATQVQTYLTKNPTGAVILKADRQVTYEQLAKLLAELQRVGGERVSLAITN